MSWEEWLKMVQKAMTSVPFTVPYSTNEEFIRDLSAVYEKITLLSLRMSQGYYDE